jgi:hypothetical protein
VQDLAQLLIRWDDTIRYVLPDSSFYIHHPQKVEDADFADLLGLSPSEPVCLLFPMTVVDELDVLKESRNPRVRWRSGCALAVLERVLSDAGRGTLCPVDTSTLPQTGIFRAETMVEVLFDQPGHLRLPNADDEIIDRALGAHVLAGRHGVTLLTYDTGQATRARTTGLHVLKLAGDQGTGDEPDWAAEDSRPGSGGQAQRRARASAAGQEGRECPPRPRHGPGTAQARPRAPGRRTEAQRPCIWPPVPAAPSTPCRQIALRWCGSPRWLGRRHGRTCPESLGATAWSPPRSCPGGPGPDPGRGTRPVRARMPRCC